MSYSKKELKEVVDALEAPPMAPPRWYRTVLSLARQTGLSYDKVLEICSDDDPHHPIRKSNWPSKKGQDLYITWKMYYRHKLGAPKSAQDPSVGDANTIVSSDGIVQAEHGRVVDVEDRLTQAAASVKDILSRRREREEDFLADLRDDCDAIGEIIDTLDNLFIALVRGFRERRVISDSALLEVHVRQTEIYLTDRHLLPLLLGRMEAIASTTSDPLLEAEAYGALAQTLRALTNSLEQYRADLGTGAWTAPGQRQEWNLELLCERARDRDLGDGFLETSVEEMAEQVSRNHDFALSDSIHELVGAAQQLAKGHPDERLDHSLLEDVLARCQDPSLSSHDKGKALERLSVALFSACYAVEPNLRTQTGEVDLYLDDRKVTTPFWDDYGDNALVECKNWSKPVGSREVLVLIGKCTRADSKLGFFVSLGPFSEDALSEIKGQNQRRGRSGSPLIVPVRLSDIEALERYQEAEHWLRTLVRLARQGRKGFYGPRYTHP